MWVCIVSMSINSSRLCRAKDLILCSAGNVCAIPPSAKSYEQADFFSEDYLCSWLCGMIGYSLIIFPLFQIAGLCLNCWTLQELVSRDAGNYLILLEKILQKTQEVKQRETWEEHKIWWWTTFLLIQLPCLHVLNLLQKGNHLVDEHLMRLSNCLSASFLELIPSLLRDIWSQ